MKITNVRIAVACCLAFVPATAPAKVPLIEYEVHTDELVVLAGGGEAIGVERVVVPGDAIMTTRLGVPEMAFTEASATVERAGMSEPFTKGEVLARARFRKGSLGDAKVFCGAQRKPPKNRKLSPELGRRFRPVVRFCLVDADSDASFESAFLAGALWPDEGRVFSIPKMAYRTETNIPLPASSLTMTFEKGALLQGPVLTLSARLLGRPVDMAQFKIGDDRGKMETFSVARSVLRDAPFQLEFGDAKIAVTGYEPEGRKLTLRVEKPFETRPFDYVLTDRTIYIYY